MLVGMRERPKGRRVEQTINERRPATGLDARESDAGWPGAGAGAGGGDLACFSLMSISDGSSTVGCSGSALVRASAGRASPPALARTAQTASASAAAFAASSCSGAEALTAYQRCQALTVVESTRNDMAGVDDYSTQAAFRRKGEAKGQGRGGWSDLGASRVEPPTLHQLKEAYRDVHRIARALQHHLCTHPFT
jgi:hypothetical protein